MCTHNELFRMGILKPDMKKIKAGLLIDEFFGGAGTAFGGYGFLARKYIAKYLPGKEIEVDVLLEKKEGLNEVTAQKVDETLVYRFPCDDEKIKNWLKEKNYDVFLSIELTWPSYEILKLVDDKKLILWIQDPRPQSAWDKIDTMTSIKDHSFFCREGNELINKLTKGGRVKYISQGHSLNPLAFELYNLPKGTPVEYLPNPIEIDWNFEFDISKKKKQVIFLGRLEAQKRAWLFCEVAKRMPEYDFYVLGKFFRYKEDNEKMLEPYMKGDIPNLHFAGHLEGEEKEKLLRESRVLLNTSIWEGIPISWLECLQYGTLLAGCLDNEKLTSRFGKYVGEIKGDGYSEVEKFLPAVKELMEDDEFYSEKAREAINYIRKNHNIPSFQKSLRALVKKYKYNKTLFALEGFIKGMRKFTVKGAKYLCYLLSLKLPVNRGKVYRAADKKANANFKKPDVVYVDLKITYACNYKCEYCYQVKNSGERIIGTFSKENIDNLMVFLKRTKEKKIITLAGGEPFVYPHLDYLARKCRENGHIVSIITNFSAPFEKIEKFITTLEENIITFSISIHLSQIKDLEEFYSKLQKLIELKEKLGLKFNTWLTCVLTEENFEKLKEVDATVRERFGLNIEIQRAYHNGIYDIYSKEIEDYMTSRGLDVPKDEANKINFYGRRCWSGSKFFYIEHNGDVKRCYANQINECLWQLGNLAKPKQIKIFNSPVACYSCDRGNCPCHKHFMKTGLLLEEYAPEKEIENCEKYAH